MSIQIEISQRGLSISLLARDVYEKLLPELVKAAVDCAYDFMTQIAPVKTGRLLASIRKQVQGLEGSVAPTVPYAVYVEYGTQPHEIRPVRGRVLAFQVEDRMVFTPLVHHPGTKPRPFIKITNKAVAEKIPELWEKIMSEEVR